LGKAHKLQVSRENWKEKAIDRGAENRKQNRVIKTLREENKTLKNELKTARNEQPQELLPIHQLGDKKFQLFYLICVLFLCGAISFRAVSRIAGILGELLHLGRPPCVQTCINAILKLSIAKMMAAKNLLTQKNPSYPFSNGWIWLIDSSIGLGAGKILTILALPGDFFKNHSRAPTLADMHAVGVAVASSWTGQTIASFLRQIIAQIGIPLALLKDAGTDLSKAVKVLAESGIPLLNIADLAHVVANILRHHYEHHPLMHIFLTACGQASSNFKQSILACLAPPGIKTKARFMNLILLVRWAQRILEHSPVGRATEGSVLQKLRQYVGKLVECRTFIKAFLADASPLIACQKLLKLKGLTQETYKDCLKLIEAIPTAGIRQEFQDWLGSQFAIAKALGLNETGLPISSDGIESLFGRAKVHGTGPIKDADRIALRIPALCGGINAELIQSAMKVTTTQLNSFVEPLQSLTKQRREHLSHPGTLENLAQAKQTEHVCFIPGLKAGLNSTCEADLSTNFQNISSPKNIVFNSVPLSA